MTAAEKARRAKRHLKKFIIYPPTLYGLRLGAWENEECGMWNEE
jgi:hypothetical protein